MVQAVCVQHKRPEIPPTAPPSLADCILFSIDAQHAERSVIQKCWSPNPEERPVPIILCQWFLTPLELQFNAKKSNF